MNPAAGAEAMVSLERARALVLAAAAPLPGEVAPLAAAGGRVLAAPVVATFSHPSADNSAMDGYAVRAADVAGASPAVPVTLTVVGESRTGHPPTAAVDRGEAVRIFTGGLLPGGADAVLVQELVLPGAGGQVNCLGAVGRGANVRRAGEEFVAGDELLPAGSRLSPAAIGLLASAGVGEAVVTRRPRVALLAIGDELSGDSPGLAHRFDSNTPMIAAACREAGAEVVAADHRRDEVAEVAAWLRAATGRADVVLTCGSASVGAHDVVAAAWQAAGIAPQFTRVAIKPGKPVRFGLSQTQAPVFALPGNPLACLTGFEQLVAPALVVLGGSSWAEPARVRLALAHDYQTGHDSAYLLRAALEGDRLRVPPRQGAAMLRDAATQPLVAHLPGGAQLVAGQTVEATLLPGALDGCVVQPVAPLPCAVSVRARRSGAGKTLLIEQLLPALAAAGLRVGTVKHAHHPLEPDTPGKDSYRHYAAGAAQVLLLGGGRTALFGRCAADADLPNHLELFAGCVDLVLVEGFRDEPLPAVLIDPDGAGFDLARSAADQWLVTRPALPGADWCYPTWLVTALVAHLTALVGRATT